MSRTSKLRRKRLTRQSVVYDQDEKGKRLARRKGPAQTKPAHGKVNRWPYDAEWRRKKTQPKGM